MSKGNDFSTVIDLMQYAINQLQTNLQNNSEVPVYALLLNKLQIIDECCNIGNQHAESILLHRNTIDNNNFDLLVTLEPCPACFFQIYNSKIQNIFFGGFNYQYGPCGGKFHLLHMINQEKSNVFGGFLKEQNENLIKNFFIKLRLG